MNNQYAVDTFALWYQNNRDNFEKNCVSNRFEDSGYGSAVVQLETEKYLIDISVWNHASCLDVGVIKKATEENIFPATGSCETKHIFEKYLESFIQ